jgi:CsoR family transcriptional regulator, copper-sensing transcriptional repressor
MSVKPTTSSGGATERQGEASGLDRHAPQRHGYADDKDDFLKRLRRIEGQMRGLQRMIEDDKYCIDILTQVSAAKSALESVALGLLEQHLAHCVAQAVAEGADSAEARTNADMKVREASQAIARLVRS